MMSFRLEAATIFSRIRAPPSPLIEIQLRIDLVGTVHVDVELFDLVEGGERNAELRRQFGAGLRRGHAANTETGLDALAEGVNERGGGPAGAEAEHHAVLDRSRARSRWS